MGRLARLSEATKRNSVEFAVADEALAGEGIGEGAPTSTLTLAPAPVDDPTPAVEPTAADAVEAATEVAPEPQAEAASGEDTETNAAAEDTESAGEGAGQAPEEAAPEPKKQKSARKPAAGRPAAARRAPKVKEEPVDQEAEQARWLSMMRKEFRMHPQQAEDLKILTMRVNRQGRRDPGERVTDNTLIRIGLALLLEKHKNELRGSNEDELRASVGLPPLDEYLEEF